VPESVKQGRTPDDDQDDDQDDDDRDLRKVFRPHRHSGAQTSGAIRFIDAVLAASVPKCSHDNL
jgi:hypothetical protein